MVISEKSGLPMSGISELSTFLSSIATQVRAAIEVGVPTDESAEARQADPFKWLFDRSNTREGIRGRMTRNGRRSLEIGSGKTQVDA